MALYRSSSLALPCNEAKKKILEKNGEVDFSWESQENIRLRINMYKNHSSLALAIRLLHKHIPNFRELGLPLILEKNLLK